MLPDPDLDGNMIELVCKTPITMAESDPQKESHLTVGKDTRQSF
jgi:hypothetical protein